MKEKRMYELHKRIADTSIEFAEETKEHLLKMAKEIDVPEEEFFELAINYLEKFIKDHGLSLLH